MTTRAELEKKLLNLTSSKSGRGQIAKAYRETLKGRPPMPVADYAAMIAQILDAEFPPKKSRQS